MRTILTVAALAIAALGGFAAWAGMPVSQTMRCPVGGKSFRYTTTASYSTWGSRPDGKPYGSWEFPLALPVCPDNGLVVYDEFSEPEIARLKPLVASTEYQALRKDNVPRYLAQWLMRRMSDGAEDPLWMLLQASWEADNWPPSLKRQYQAEFAEGVRKLTLNPDDINSVALWGRAVNALRELGRFDDASALLGSIPLASLDVPVPEPRYGESTRSGLGKPLLNDADIRAAKNRRGWLDYLKQLVVLIDRRDASSEPLDAIPERVAASRCVDAPGSLDAASLRLCSEPALAEQVALLKKARAQ